MTHSILKLRVEKSQRSITMFEAAILVLALSTAFVLGSVQGSSPDGFASSFGNTVPLLNVVQVAPIVKVPEFSNCVVPLMQHTFAFSYGKPFVGKY